jgi:hypothetical protein
MKRLIILYGFFSTLLTLQAQPYGNEWINYAQSYAKIKVARQGVYRISGATLLNCGLPAVGNGYKLYRNGTEVPMYATTNSNITDNDYIEFYGTPNDGSLDTELYRQASDQFNPNFSLFNDTAVYFLTSDNSSPAMRYTDSPNDLSNLPDAEPYFIHKIHKNIAQSGRNGKPEIIAGANWYYPDFNAGQGFGSTVIGVWANAPFNVPLYLGQVYKEADAPIAQLKSIAMSHYSSSFDEITNLDIVLSVNDRPYQIAHSSQYQKIDFDLPVFINDLQDTTIINYNVPDATDFYNEAHSVYYVALQYPRYFDFGNKPLFAFTLPDQAPRYITISNADTTNNEILYDLSNNLRLTPILDNNVWKIKLPQGNALGERQLLWVRSNMVAPVPCSFPCNANNYGVFMVNDLQAQPFVNYSASAGNYLLISNPILRQGTTDWVSEYANYRASAQGGSYSVAQIDVTQLYDQYAYGVAQHPLAIQHFINHAIDTWSIAPQYLLLLGKGISYSKARFYSPYYLRNLVPAYGLQPNDGFLSIRNAQNTVPQLSVGRVSASSPQEVQAYLQKLQSYESLTCGDNWNWVQNNLLIASTHSDTYDAALSALLADYAVGIDTTLSLSATLLPNASAASVNTYNNAIVNGVSILNVSGSASMYGFLFSNVTDTIYTQNINKYPLGIFNTPFIGNVFDIQPVFFSQLVLADSSGLIAMIGNTGFELSTIDHIFNKYLYAQLLNTNQPRKLGDAMREAIAQTLNYIPDTTSHAYKCFKGIAHGKHLEGDPAILLAFHKLPLTALSFSLPDTLQLAATDFPFTLSPQAPDAVQYAWSNGSNSPTLSINNAGTYSVTVSNAQGCTASATIVVTSNVGVAEPMNNFVLPRIYPNPTANYVFIEGLIANKTQLALYDPSGKIIWQADNISDGSTKIEMTNLPAAHYHLHIVQNGRVMVHKVVKQ